MTLRDLLVVSTGNLWRMKLRTILTVAGVVIAIATFVAMVSFGAGNQEYITREFNELGLFSTMHVYPKGKTNDTDTTTPPKLDGTALRRLADVPGVNLVYPFDAFPVRVHLADSTFDSRAQGLTHAAMQTKLFSRMRAGRVYDDDSSRRAVISSDLLERAGINAADSAIGLPLVISVAVSTVDSGLAHIVMDKGESILDHVKRIHFDSLFHSSYRRHIFRTGMNEAARRFMNGFMHAQRTISDTLVVCGVREGDEVGRLRIEPIIVPVATAARLKSGGIGGNPADIFMAMSTGKIFAEPDDPAGTTFPQVTLDLDPTVMYKSVKDSVETLGYRTFSFAEQFEKIQQFFFYFDLALGILGLIALITASLGIINTLVMSINERKREIGILKSLGAGEHEIRTLFLVESGVIGLLGTVGGIVTGWGISRIISAVARMFMRNEGIPEVDLFALPIWLVGIALAIGIGVSLLAGLYPAARASRVNPVETLRNE